MSGRMNIIHASDSLESAEKEMQIFFKPKEIHEYKLPLTPSIYSTEEIQEMSIPKTSFGKPRKLPGQED
jgi:hypothetical protein